MLEERGDGSIWGNHLPRAEISHGMRNEIKANKRKEQESLFKKIVYRQRSM
jgi:hypothetical protein